MYKLIFEDNFCENNLNAKYWNIENGNKWHNGEKQAYTNRLENVYIENNILHIRALKEEYMDRSYTSARINTRGKVKTKYGKIKVVAKVPKGLGTWPAIWLMPEERNPWPLCGEIDIMEHNPSMLNQTWMTVHTKKYNHMENNSKSEIKNVDNMTDEFISYEFSWNKDNLCWYINGEKLHELKRKSEDDFDSWPFDQEFYLIINMAVGGWFINQIIDDNSFPQEFLIKNVQIYEEI